ncbi:MAG: LPS export ABC transporter periplasmic protein LptC [Terriglobales bacterium]
MPVFITRLRRWFAAAAIALVLLVGGVYFYAKLRVQNALKQVPEKIGVEIQQSATGFTISKSEQGRTWFKIEASKAVQFKQGGRAHLHDVTVTIYGRDSSRYDRISGADFDYDPQAGNVTAIGEVQIDLEANPGGTANLDQAAPSGLKNPIHLKTSGLVFNQKTGDASTRERVDFSLPQATGSAVGVRYLAGTGELMLESQVNILTRSTGVTLNAVRATVMKVKRQIWLDHPHLTTASRQCQSDQATLFLRPDNRVSRVLATGNILIQTDADPAAKAQGDQLELLMGGKQEGLRTAILSGNVTAEMSGAQPMQASAGRVILDFGSKNQVAKVHTEENVRLVQHQTSPDASHPAQDLQLTASAVDFLLSDGSRLDRAETFGAAQIAIHPAGSGDGRQTLVTAGKFDAHFDNSGQLSTVHGFPDARIVSQNPGQLDRVSTSRTLDATFQPGRGIETLVQQGSVAYNDGGRKAWAEHGRYTTADQMLVLTGSPRVTEGGMTTTAQTMRLDRATGTAFADGDVKSTYSDLAPQPNGALLASSSPIHVTAHSMTAHRAAATALYRGGARLWQDANVVEAPAIDFDRDHRSLLAQGTPAQPVSTVLVQSDSRGNSTPVAITCSRLTYADDERKAHFEGNVLAKETNITITARQMDAFLQARGVSADRSPSAGKLDKIVATGGVVATQPQRRAEGEHLVYAAGEDKLVLTGGSPSIFDAEQGKITGVSLTFFRHDDRVLVEGNSSSPAVTQTRVAR